MSHRPVPAPLSHRPLLLAVLLSGFLSACGGGGTPDAAPAPKTSTPVASPVASPVAPTPTPSLPAPTLGLSESAVTLTSGQSVSLAVQTNRAPDRLEVSGAPSGLSASVQGGVLNLSAQNVEAGTYPVTLTGFWGSEQRQVRLVVTVVAPTPAPAPIPTPTPTPPAPTPTPAPDFSLAVSPAVLSVTQGQSGSATINVTRTGGLGGDVQFSVTAPAGLQANVVGGVVVVNAASANVGSYVLTVSGTAQGLTRQTTLTVQVTAQPASVSAVRVQAGTTSLRAGESTDLQALVSGTGAFSSGVTWKVTSSAGVQVSLQEKAGGAATLNVAAASASGQVQVTASSSQDPTISNTLTLTVQAQPQTVSLALPNGPVSFEAGGTATLNYSGKAVRVDLAAPTPLVSRVSLQNVTETGGQVVLTAGSSGSGTAQLAFTMADGTRFTVGVPLEVAAAPAPAPAPAPTPAPTPAPSGYVWYPESQRAPNAAEQEVLRLTNELRAKGGVCDGVTYAPAPALRWNDQLAYAARNHALDMGKRSYFSHMTPEGVSFSTRVTQAGYLWRTLAENIAAGYPTPAEVVDGWLKSPGHCKNMLSPEMTELGVGGVNVAGSSHTSYWVQDFGRPQP